MQLVRFFHTIRRLRPVQLYGRAWHRFNPARPDLSPPPPLRTPSRAWNGPLLRNRSMLDVDRFRFLHIDGELRSAADWNSPDREKLWLYNLHYFDDLNAVGAADRVQWHRTHIARWVRENSPGEGNGWEPYPTSLRIVNWIKWSLVGNALACAWQHSLAVQVRWLSRHIEWHLLGNHLLVNAKALVFAGLFFEGVEADAWLAQGVAILGREVPEQVLPDGGHFELSPMYHAIVLEDLLDLIAASAVWPGAILRSAVAQWQEAVTRMLIWGEGLSHPDGEIGFFNDSALGVAPNIGQLLVYAQQLGIAPSYEGPTTISQQFVNSGYIRLQGGDAVALLDVAPIGPDYQPGHAPADTLAFELSLFGQRVFVNSGTGQYGSGPARLHQRGTAAHNTVQIDEADSSEVWGGFRVARRARPFGLKVENRAGMSTIACAHDGYRRLKGKPVHRRCWMMKERQLQVMDEVAGNYRSAVARLYLHPRVSASHTDGVGELCLANGKIARWTIDGASTRIVASHWHPEFGLTLPSQCIELHFERPSICFELCWD